MRKINRCEKEAETRKNYESRLQYRCTCSCLLIGALKKYLDLFIQVVQPQCFPLSDSFSLFSIIPLVVTHLNAEAKFLVAL